MVELIHYQSPKECHGETEVDSIVSTTPFWFKQTEGGWNFLDGDGNDYFRLLEDGKWFYYSMESYPNSEDDREKCVRKARSRLNERKYSIPWNNCEHFVTEILSGEKYSSQVGVVAYGIHFAKSNVCVIS